MLFEWDESKAVQNLRKHRVSFAEAATIFGDPLAITFADPDHSSGEARYLTFGLSAEGTELVVSHTDRGDIIRIISSRKMTRREKAMYQGDG